MQGRRWHGWLVASLLVMGCGDGDEAPRDDSGADAGVAGDAGSDGSTTGDDSSVDDDAAEGEMDAARDTGTTDDTGSGDTGTGTSDGSAEAGSDAATDSGSDAAPLDNPIAPVSAEVIVPANPGSLTATDPNLLVAFIGDQGNDPTRADRVLQLIEDEGAQAVVHNGDFDYQPSPAAFDARIDSILGADFPYFATIGNHDAPGWLASADQGARGYASRITERYQRMQGADNAIVCSPSDNGLQSTCSFHGLLIVQSCVGVVEFGAGVENAALAARCAADSQAQTNFLRSALGSRTQMWAVCSWHKNQADMQVGAKSSEVGWNAYRICMNGGAIISTGHEHSYSRTRSLTDLGNVASSYGVTGAWDRVRVGFGSTFDFVSGLGGLDIRALNPQHASQPWFASLYTSDRWKKSGVYQTGPGSVANYGALFITFNPTDGGPTKARAYFKDIDGRRADEFEIDFDARDPRTP